MHRETCAYLADEGRASCLKSTCAHSSCEQPASHRLMPAGCVGLTVAANDWAVSSAGDRPPGRPAAGCWGCWVVATIVSAPRLVSKMQAALVMSSSRVSLWRHTGVERHTEGQRTSLTQSDVATASTVWQGAWGLTQLKHSKQSVLAQTFAPAGARRRRLSSSCLGAGGSCVRSPGQGAAVVRCPGLHSWQSADALARASRHVVPRRGVEGVRWMCTCMSRGCWKGRTVSLLFSVGFGDDITRLVRSVHAMALEALISFSFTCPACGLIFALFCCTVSVTGILS